MILKRNNLTRVFLFFVPVFILIRVFSSTALGAPAGISAISEQGNMPLFFAGGIHTRGCHEPDPLCASCISRYSLYLRARS